MKICLVSSGLEDRNRFIQPWRYLLQGAHTLNQWGHKLYIVSDGYPRLAKEDELEGYTVKRLNSLQEWPIFGNKHLARIVDELKPDIVLWHLGLTSFFRLKTLKDTSVPVIGIFTSPIYKPLELLRLGALRLLHGYLLSTVHILGLFVPSTLLQRAIRKGVIKKLVIECETTRTKLLHKGVQGDYLQVIKPYIDPAWFQIKLTHSNRILVREEFGFSSDDFVVGFFGPPAPLRGLPALIRAGEFALQKNPHIRLLVLSRQRAGEQYSDHFSVLKLIKKLRMEQWVQIVPGFLSQERLIQNLAACDVIALPFELVPSDVPISVLESMALGIPLITTDVACLPEMVPEGTGIHVPAGNVLLLAEAILAVSADMQLKRKLADLGREQAISWVSMSENHATWKKLLNLNNEAR